MKRRKNNKTTQDEDEGSKELAEAVPGRGPACKNKSAREREKGGYSGRNLQVP